MKADTPHAFIMLTGPYRNVGDSLIRRRALAWARGCGAPVIMMAGSPSTDWDLSIAIKASDEVIRSRLTWLKRIFRAPARSVLVIEPGEFNTDRRFYVSLVYLALASMILRVKRGRVVQMPRSLAQRSKVGDLVYRFAIGGGYPLWREALTERHFRTGKVVPDIGFDHAERADSVDRDLLVVSLRGDRAMPGGEWIEGVASFAEDAGLQIVAMTQVEEDNDRSLEVGTALGGEIDLWSADTSSADREHHVKEVYARCRVVLSDRLHALVIGAVAGAVPVELVPTPNGKARKHFAVIGLTDVSHDARDLSPAEVAQVLTRAVDTAEKVTESVSLAAAELVEARSDVERFARRHGSL